MIPKYDKVIVLGCGGTGSILLPLLSRYLWSQKYTGRLILIDGDSYGDNNLSRQLFSQSRVGMNKAEYQGTLIGSHIPDMADQIEIIDKFVDIEDMEKLIENGTVVINCSDNKAARKIVEDKIASVEEGIHICCGNEFTTGQVQIHSRVRGVSVTPTIYERSPVFNSMEDNRAKMSCEELAALPSGGQLITANAMCAVLAMNMFVQATNEEAIYQGGTWLPNDMVIFDTKHNKFKVEGEKPLDFKKAKEYANAR